MSPQPCEGVIPINCNLLLNWLYFVCHKRSNIITISYRTSMRVGLYTALLVRLLILAWFARTHAKRPLLVLLSDDPLPFLSLWCGIRPSLIDRCSGADGLCWPNLAWFGWLTGSQTTRNKFVLVVCFHFCDDSQSVCMSVRWWTCQGKPTCNSVVTYMDCWNHTPIDFCSTESIVNK